MVMLVNNKISIESNGAMIIHIGEEEWRKIVVMGYYLGYAPSGSPTEKASDSETGEVVEQSREGGVRKCSGHAVDKIKRFFIEHPIHSFSPLKIANYLGLEITQVIPILKSLETEGIVVCTGWKLKNLDLVKARTLKGGN